MNCALDIQVDEAFQGIGEEWIRKVANTALARQEINYPVRLSMVVTDDETVRQLNHVYRGIDETTDVLAFAFQDFPFPQPPDGVTQLGEVIISYSQAERQAEEQKHSLKEEIALLAIHGILHLAGYDHQQMEDEQEMRTREAEILTRIKCHMS